VEAADERCRAVSGIAMRYRASQYRALYLLRPCSTDGARHLLCLYTPGKSLRDRFDCANRKMGQQPRGADTGDPRQEGWSERELQAELFVLDGKLVLAPLEVDQRFDVDDLIAGITDDNRRRR
jgi:hypothetical protein